MTETMELKVDFPLNSKVYPYEDCEAFVVGYKRTPKGYILKIRYDDGEYDTVAPEAIMKAPRRLSKVMGEYKYINCELKMATPGSFRLAYCASRG